MSDDEEFKKQLADTRFNIRASMRHIQLHFDMLKQTMEACDAHIAKGHYGECAEAIDQVISVSSKFIRYDAELITEINDLRRLIRSNKMEKT
jgi:hypothetical protein